MPHFPKPFFKKARKLWYVQIDGKYINLGPDRDEACRRYHELMVAPKQSANSPVRDLLSIIGSLPRVYLLEVSLSLSLAALR